MYQTWRKNTDMGFAQKLQRCHEYVHALEEEKRKIQVFQRELPLCLELVTQAIEACKKELAGTSTTAAATYMQRQSSECSEQTSSDAPVLEEFMPLKRTCSSEENDEEHTNKPTTSNGDKKKSDWLRSVQLWNQSPDPPLKEDEPRKTAVVEVKRNGGAFLPFHREKKMEDKPNSAVLPAAATSSTTETVVSKGGGARSSKRGDKEGQSGQRKQRRCWSPELHRRFLHVLQELGGPHAATPKQIREVMKVDGLTNDEVKSHLQKYRLHSRRPSPTIHDNGNTQTPQFVVVGGIWVPPPEYASAGEAAAAGAISMGRANGIYAPPMAAPPQTAAALMRRSQKRAQSENMQSEEGGSHSVGGGLHISSSATSSSIHTTTHH